MGEIMRNPSNPAEWQEAVDAADLVLVIDSLRQYDLITGGPEGNIARCETILEKGRKRGYYPSRTHPKTESPILPKKRGRGRPRKVTPTNYA